MGTLPGSPVKVNSLLCEEKWDIKKQDTSDTPRAGRDTTALGQRTTVTTVTTVTDLQPNVDQLLAADVGILGLRLATGALLVLVRCKHNHHRRVFDGLAG